MESCGVGTRVLTGIVEEAHRRRKFVRLRVGLKNDFTIQVIRLDVVRLPEQTQEGHTSR